MAKSIRCKACRQLKSAEEELCKAQATMHEQSINISRQRSQFNNIYNKLNKLKRDLNEAMVENSKLSSQLSFRGQEVRELKERISVLEEDK